MDKRWSAVGLTVSNSGMHTINHNAKEQEREFWTLPQDFGLVPRLSHHPVESVHDLSLFDPGGHLKLYLHLHHLSTYMHLFRAVGDLNAANEGMHCQ